MDNFVWLKGNYGEKELWVRTTNDRGAVSEFLIQERDYHIPAKVSDTLAVSGRLVQTIQRVSSRGDRMFDFPMTLPHIRVKLTSETTQLARAWCIKHGFDQVIADDTDVVASSSAQLEVDDEPTEYVLVVYSCFAARIWPREASAWVGSGDNDPTPLKRFPIRCKPGALLIEGPPTFDGYAGIRFPDDVEGEEEFRKILVHAACWLAEWQSANGGSNDGDWPGWSDDDARAYTVGLFQHVQQASMLNRIGDHEIGGGSMDPAMTASSSQPLQETVSEGAIRGEPGQPTPAEVVSVVQALDTVEDVAEAAHLGGMVTQEWTETFKLGDVHSAVAFDLGEIAESISAEYAMPVGAVRADFGDWLGMRGPDMIADLVGGWLADLARRAERRRRSKIDVGVSGGPARW